MDRVDRVDVVVQVDRVDRVQAVVAVADVLVAVSVPNNAPAAQPIIVPLVAVAAVVAAMVVAVVVVVEGVLKLRLNEISPVTIQSIKLNIAYEKRRVKNIAIGEGGNEMKEVINGRMKEHLVLNEASVLIDFINKYFLINS